MMRGRNATPRGRSLSISVLIVLAFVSFTIALGYGVLLPHLPDVIAARVANGDAPAVIARQVAWITGLFVAAPILFSPLWGLASDRIGRRPVLSIGLIGYAITSILPPVETGIEALYAFRFASGVFAAAVAPAVFAVVVDLASDGESRARGFAWIGIASAGGYFFGPVLGGAGAIFSNALSYPSDSLWVPLSVQVVLTLCALAALPILPAGRPMARVGDRGVIPNGKGKRSLANRLLLLASIAGAAVAAFEIAITMHARGLGLGADRLALIFAECSLVMLVAQALVFHPRWDAHMTRLLVVPAFAVMAIGLAISPIAASLPTSMMVTGAVAASGGLLAPILAYWLSLASDQGHGLGQGRNNAAVSLGQTVGTIGAGYLAGWYGASGAPFFVVATVVALTALASLTLPRQLAALAQGDASLAARTSRQMETK